MCQKSFTMLEYIDDYVRVGVPSVVHVSYVVLLDLNVSVGFNGQPKEVGSPATQVTCLGVLIDTVKGTVSIPPEKLEQINIMVRQWLSKSVISKHQLQSILGLLLFVHKCVKLARVFINKMLQLPLLLTSNMTFSGLPRFCLGITTFFAQLWSTKKILIHCDNQAVVTVLKSGKAHDAFLAASARNIWYLTAVHDIDVQYSHMKRASNQWQGSVEQVKFLYSQICDPVWLPVSVDLLDLDPYL